MGTSEYIELRKVVDSAFNGGKITLDDHGGIDFNDALKNSGLNTSFKEFV